jgi:hypothetical protein
LDICTTFSVVWVLGVAAGEVWAEENTHVASEATHAVRVLLKSEVRDLLGVI